MKKSNIYRGVALLAATTSLTLLGGCTKNATEEKPDYSFEDEHLIVEFGNETVIFRESEGYSLNTTIGHGRINCYVYDGKEKAFECRSSNFNLYYANEQTDEIEKKLIEDGAIVYKLNK